MAVTQNLALFDASNLIFLETKSQQLHRAALITNVVILGSVYESIQNV